MKNLYILLLIVAVPTYVSAVTYTNKTSGALTISKVTRCADDDMKKLPEVEHVNFFQSLTGKVVMHEECLNGVCDKAVVEEPCMEHVAIELLPGQSAEFNNEQGQYVTITSKSLNEQRPFFPTNDSFNYEITESHYGAKFSRLTINRAQ